MDRAGKLMKMYDAMLQELGESGWWPGESPLEIMLGAVLTQNTAWGNVEKAIDNLKKAGLLDLEALFEISLEDLAEQIRPAGYFRVKAGRIKALLTWIKDFAGGDIKSLSSHDTWALREELLGVKGVGPETADAILLYALDRPSFVADEYTRRILSRHGMVPEEAGYDELRDFFMDALPEEVSLFNEYHALIVRVGKQWCTRRKPDCKNCPLLAFLEQGFYE